MFVLMFDKKKTNQRTNERMNEKKIKIKLFGFYAVATAIGGIVAFGGGAATTTTTAAATQPIIK